MTHLNLVETPEQKTLAAFIEENQITMTLQRVPTNPTMECADEMINYMVVLTFGKTGRTMTTFFSTGCGWVEEKPKQNLSLIGFGMGGVRQADLEQIRKSHVIFDVKNNRFTMQGGFGRGVRITMFQNELMQRMFQIKQPTVADVLDCLRSDADVNNYQRFEDWASDMGYDTDSRKAEKIYRACIESARNLEDALGRSSLKELIEDVERL